MVTVQVSVLISWNTASLRVLDKLGGFHQLRTTSDEQGHILWFACDRPAG